MLKLIPLFPLVGFLVNGLWYALLQSRPGAKKAGSTVTGGLASLAILGSFGHGGHYAGEFAITHVMASDSKGNLYVGETIGGNRVQKFLFKGLAPAR